MGYITLHPDDQAKYGAPPVIPFDLSAVGVRQRAALEKASKRSLRWMLDQLQGVPELDENDNPIAVPVFEDDGVTPVFEADGVTQAVVPRLTRDGEAIAMVVWLALWGIGIKVPWDTFDPREVGLVIRAGDPDDEGDSGKDEEPAAESSTTSAPS